MCSLPKDDTWGDHKAACAGAYMVVSLDGLSCIPQCGDNEKAVEGRCVCKENAVVDWTGTGCVPRSECTRILLSS